MNWELYENSRGMRSEWMSKFLQGVGGCSVVFLFFVLLLGITYDLEFLRGCSELIIEMMRSRSGKKIVDQSVDGGKEDKIECWVLCNDTDLSHFKLCGGGQEEDDQGFVD